MLLTHHAFEDPLGLRNAENRSHGQYDIQALDNGLTGCAFGACGFAWTEMKKSGKCITLTGLSLLDMQARMTMSY